MTVRKDSLSLIITRVSAAVALTVAVSLPLGYGLIAFGDFREALKFKAEVKAVALDNLIANDPELWALAGDRIQATLDRSPKRQAHEHIRVYDVRGEQLAESGQPPSAPFLVASFPLHDADRVVGRVEISASQSEPLIQTLIAALHGILLGLLVYFVMRVVPIRALRRLTDDLYAEKERAETTLSSISDAVVTTDEQGRVEYLNPTAERLLGTRLNVVRQRPIADIIRLLDATSGALIENTLLKALTERRVVSCKGDSDLCRTDQTSVAVEERSAPIFDREGRVTGGVTVLRDVSESRAFQQRRSWEATHDPLTEIINRREFENRIRRALADTQETGRSHVVCFMDLDRFKVVNDSCGHAAGDKLLIQLCLLITARIRDTDTLARLGGDEFGALLEGCDIQRAKIIAADIMAAIADFSFVWESKLFSVGVSIGLTVISREHASVNEILGEADCACYWAKEQGRNRACVFQASDMNLAARRSETGWVPQINAAFEEGRFVLYQQPYRALSAQAENRDHIEILLRMVSRNGEVVVPGRFLPAAERYNLIPDIDRWVIHTVFSNYQTLVAERGGKALTCGINLSGASINAEGFIDYIRQQVEKYDLQPGSICFELTETVAVNNLQAAADFILACKSLGIEFALDDFGTGSSSFGYLKNLPVDYLKIDGSFVRNIEHDRIDLAMTETINRIGHIMGMQTVAEFAENEAIIGLLRDIGVDYAQGYGISQPQLLFLPTDGPEVLYGESDLILRG